MAATPLLLPNGRTLDRVPLSSILYVSVEDKLCKVVTFEREYLITASLQSLLPQLPEPEFVQIHRNYVVSINNIHTVGETEVTIANQKLPVSRSNRTKLFSCFRKYS